MKRALLSLALLPALGLGQYKYEPAGPPPDELAPAIRQTLQTSGHRVIGPKGVFAELWFRAQAPAGPATSEQGVSLTTIPHGALLGVIRFAAPGADCRGQTIKPGTYTMRLSYHPLDGAHEGVAPQRDFLLLVPAAEDADPSSTPAYEQVVAMSTKTSGTSHPASLGTWKLDKTEPAGLNKEGEGDWVLHATVGDIPIAVVVIGTHRG